MTRPLGWLLFLAATVLVAVAVYFGLRAWRPAPQGTPVPPAVVPSTVPPPLAQEPAIRHPVPIEKEARAGPLPSLDASDAVLQERIAELLSEQSVAEFLNVKELARRVVATVDNLPRQKVAPRVMPVKPVPPPFLATGTDESAIISEKNAARYVPYVRLLENLDAGRLVAVYVRFYPLFQQAYEELGYPRGYFNDRLIEVLDGLLVVPEVQEPVRLVRPKVFYRFADPALESLPAGQKILIRMGPENAARVRWKLREIRKELVRQGGRP